MSDILILKNVTREGPGLLAGVLESHGITYDVVDLDKGEQLPSIVGYKALVVLGGPDSANDTSEKMTSELAFVTQAIDNGLPYLGVCLGMQVLVHAAGGQVVPGQRKEVGFMDADGQPYAITFTEAGRDEPLFTGLHSPLPVFQLHGEVVELRPDMKLLGTAPVCENQIVKVGVNAYGIQSHFELTDDMLRVWAAEDPDLAPIPYETLARDFAAIKEEYTKTGETLLQNFLRIAGLIR